MTISTAPNAAETVSFALDSGVYEIDLSTVNADALREALKPYVTNGRATRSAVKRQAGKPSTGGNKAENQAIRAWASLRGKAVSDRGRIPGAVVEAYRATAPSAS